ncbi:hypothetical protein BAUCODRAFT_175118 [Baudoinia panamericana UAMH 10762]|uniref:Uncharacterized protein n=1 Tax=Baudoinia panamericana (strain UAMH 10762) TaxID=717646 RepID=M2N8X4_BAUPA|nr:uncharacterized protein BAUCODRAFT_175118 [Baudoinia panamericana UAMH 10762]EMD00599.1 hypothetical protein BAUCODRAFT_175118 [Baudoinia panamericana UAMH 10762]
MSLSDCQICGETLFSPYDLTSDPSQHFCIELNGPAIIHAGVVEDEVSADYSRLLLRELANSSPGCLEFGRFRIRGRRRRVCESHAYRSHGRAEGPTHPSRGGYAWG